MALTFEVRDSSEQCAARTGVVTTAHGSFHTPAFMTVGTKGSVKGLLPGLVRATGAEIVLNNTYHMLLRPGPDLVEKMGGVHRFMGWERPILTDSGGYQAYSMADINAVDEDGVTFKSIVSGSAIRMTPEFATEVQNKLGADIIMAFDDCPPSVDPDAGPINQVRLRQAAMRDAMKKRGYDHGARLDAANERTARWLVRCQRAHTKADIQSLFGIVQGGTDLDRRDRSVELVCNVDCPGYAIGGVAVGEQADDIARVVRHTAPKLPADRPRYLMGVGYPRDIVAAVCAGVDMFDCVLPTRNGRNANAFIRDPEHDPEGRGQIRLRNAKFTDDPRPLEPGCDCVACTGRWPEGVGGPGLWVAGEGGEAKAFSRGYIRHLFLAEEMLGPILVSLHNLRFFQRLMLELRSAIANDDWLGFAQRWPLAAVGLPPGVLGTGVG